MNHSDDDEMTAVTQTLPAIAATDDDSDLARRAGAGDQQAFDLLYDRYFARTSWFFLTIFDRREAKRAIREVMTELFGSLDEPFDHSLAERAYRLCLATELRHAKLPAKAASKHAAPAKVAITTSRAAKA
jgi:hypothetical protein